MSSPIVKLEGIIQSPYNLAVAAARTCYSSKGIIRVPDVTKNEKTLQVRDKIALSTREAGHLTTRQHAHFVFSIDRVSRNFIWSFLHSHPFYNSEQVSQRYVKVSPEQFTTPPLPEQAKAIYEQAIRRQMEDYEALIEILLPTVREEYYGLFPVRRKYPERYEPVVKKKAYEVARYALPIAAQAYLYHTVSALTLMRYYRLMNYYDTPWEQRRVVLQMVEQVLQVDPDFEKELVDPEPLETTLEHRFLRERGAAGNPEFRREFDASLGGKISALVDYKSRAPETLAQSVRTVLGLCRADLSDEAAIESVLDPAINPQIGDTLNLNTMTKLTRTLNHVHYTFRKKISHSADSQDQRHRMIPGSRPLLEAHYFGDPDYVTPKLVAQLPEAMERFRASMRHSFAAIEKLLNEGVAKEFALYLLPNAFPIRFEESGDLLHLHHKWHSRACYTAQEEIFYATVDELQAVAGVHPQLVRHILAPCSIRSRAGIKPICPEGERFCGVQVWKKSLEEYERTI